MELENEILKVLGKVLQPVSDEEINSLFSDGGAEKQNSEPNANI